MGLYATYMLTFSSDDAQQVWKAAHDELRRLPHEVGGAVETARWMLERIEKAPRAGLHHVPIIVRDVEPTRLAQRLRPFLDAAAGTRWVLDQSVEGEGLSSVWPCDPSSLAEWHGAEDDGPTLDEPSAMLVDAVWLTVSSNWGAELVRAVARLIARGPDVEPAIAQFLGGLIAHARNALGNADPFGWAFTPSHTVDLWTWLRTIKWLWLGWPADDLLEVFVGGQRQHDPAYRIFLRRAFVEADEGDRVVVSVYDDAPGVFWSPLVKGVDDLDE
jgi:hypothetical protein